VSYSNTLWRSMEALGERIFRNTRFELMALWLWREIRAIGRPQARRSTMYDKQTVQIMSRILEKTSNCVDVGCHKGSVLLYILKFAPHGDHFAFEPIPDLVQGLKVRFPSVNVYQLALSDFTGDSTFCHVVSDPGRSGLRRRHYPRPDEEVKEIRVKVEKLDNVIPEELKIYFIKIDVEGAQFQVLRGAVRTIKRHKPFIIFEHSASDAAPYGVTSEMVYELLVDQCGLNISLLSDWLDGKAHLSRLRFISHTESDYYFLAHP